MSRRAAGFEFVRHIQADFVRAIGSKRVADAISAALPDLLMEPNQGDLGFGEVDLTIPAFVDMGWPLNTGQVVIYKDVFED